ncbi:MAG TPA: phage major capsid protein [Gemmataceae bacterium]|nr:phage major capsid protein [Gemmataceae bacterium]
MSTIQKLREDRESVTAKILALRDVISKEDRDFNTEERASWDGANKDYDSLNSRIDAHERAARLERGDNGGKYQYEARPGDEFIVTQDRQRRNKGVRSADEHRRVTALAMQAWFCRQLGKPLTEGHRQACHSLNFRPGQKILEIRLERRPGEQLRSQSVGTNSEGGYLRPQGFVNNLEVALKRYDAVRQVAEVLRTADGRPMPWPTVNDTGNAGTLLAENAQVSEVAATFGAATFNAYKFTSGLVLVSAELDEDSAFDMTETLGSLLGERIGRGEAGYHTTGTGSSQPGGVVTGSTLGKTAASATAIAADELIDLYHAVDPAYRDSPGFGWMMHDNIAAVVRKLKDSTGRYLWGMDTLRNGQPPLLLGKGVTINQSMQSTVATGTKTVLAGDMSKMKVRDAGPIRIKRLVERYADYDQVGFIAFQRNDSKVLDAGTHPIKYLQQA